MQTFLPYPDFAKSAACLDNKRLNKQIVECKQILMALSGESKGWRNHPAVLMWKGCECCLAGYAYFCASEFESRTDHRHKLRDFSLKVLMMQHVLLVRYGLATNPFTLRIVRYFLLRTSRTTRSLVGLKRQP